MKVLHFDCFAGISGDMALGAFVDLGVDKAELTAELAKLNVSGWHLDFIRDTRCGISGTRAIVTLDNGGSGGPKAPRRGVAGRRPAEGVAENPQGSQRGGDLPPLSSPHPPSPIPHPPSEHNSYREIRALIEQSAISEGAKKRALAIFARIAEAEAQVHGTPLDEVAFHEVGALDSIVDIVGAAICLELIGPDKITCGVVELGGGTVKCAHGILPVPAPATLLLVRGMKVSTGGFDKEMTTPTGAAILAASVDEWTCGAAFTEIKTGYGLGTRKLDKPNVLRVSLRSATGTFIPALGSARAKVTQEAADGDAPHDWIQRSLIMLEANIDDMTGEELSFMTEQLFEAGALDVTTSPCVMKKSRPAHIVSVLADDEKLDAVRRAFFIHSTTIGFRETVVNRVELRREVKTLNGVRRKIVFLDAKPLREKIEFEDRAAIAREKNISLREAGSE